MDNVKNDEYYIQKIRTDLSFIVEHTRNIDLDELCENEILLDSIHFNSDICSNLEEFEDLMKGHYFDVDLA